MSLSHQNDLKKPVQTSPLLKPIHHSNGHTILNTINENLLKYDREPSHSILEVIIKLCDDALTKFTDSKDITTVRNEILLIQKKAVLLTTLPTASSLAKARWQVIRDIFIGNKSQLNMRSKPLEQPFWPEMRFKGDAKLSWWINDENEVSAHSQLLGTCGDREYISPLQLENYKAYSEKGLLFTQGKKIDTTRSIGLEVSGAIIYVMSRDGVLYVSHPDIALDQTFGHSSFLNGQPVICAGDMKVTNGQLLEISFNSGHYKPTPTHMLNCLKLLEKNYQQNLSTITVVDREGISRNAKRYLTMHSYVLPQGKLAQAQMFYQFYKQDTENGIKQNEIDKLHSYLSLSAELGCHAAKFKVAVSCFSNELKFSDKQRGFNQLQLLLKSPLSSQVKSWMKHNKKLLEPYLKTANVATVEDLFCVTSDTSKPMLYKKSNI